MAHAVDVQLLTPHVFLAHVDHALPCRTVRTRFAVATPCWPAPVSANDTMLAHTPRQQGPGQGKVVDLVGAGVQQILAFQVESLPRPVDWSGGESEGTAEVGRPA